MRKGNFYERRERRRSALIFIALLALAIVIELTALYAMNSSSFTAPALQHSH